MYVMITGVFRTARIVVAVAAVVVVLVIAACVATGDLMADEGLRLARIKSGAPTGIVEKTVVSSKLRLVFAVGLEGAGHHYIVEALEEVLTREDLVGINACGVLPPAYVADTMNYTTSHYATAQDYARRQMTALAEQGEKLEAPGTIAIAQQSEVMIPGCFKVMSYPNYGGPGKVLQYLDLAMLARVAEAAGVDFRVVYLQRSAEAIMLADTSHRHFQK